MREQENIDRFVQQPLLVCCLLEALPVARSCSSKMSNSSSASAIRCRTEKKGQVGGHRRSHKGR